MCTASHSSTRKLGVTNQIQDFEVIAKQHHTCGACAYGRLCNFCGCPWRFLQLLHSTRTTRCTHGHQTPLSPFPSSSWGVWRTRLVTPLHIIFTPDNEQPVCSKRAVTCIILNWTMLNGEKLLALHHRYHGAVPIWGGGEGVAGKRYTLAASIPGPLFYSTVT